MKEFLTTYAELVENNHDLMGQVSIQFELSYEISVVAA